MTMPLLLTISLYAANPFLDAKDDKPVSATFRGNEWGDEIGSDEIPLTARVVTTRLAKMPWGAIFKVEFTDLKSSAQKHREIRPDYFIVTDDRIVLLNEEDNDAAINQRFSTEQSSLARPRVMSGSADQIKRGGDSACRVKLAAPTNIPADSQTVLIVAVLDQLAGCAAISGE